MLKENLVEDSTKPNLFLTNKGRIGGARVTFKPLMVVELCWWAFRFTVLEISRYPFDVFIKSQDVKSSQRSKSNFEVLYLNEVLYTVAKQREFSLEGFKRLIQEIISIISKTG
jgi:hypothetical protein